LQFHHFNISNKVSCEQTIIESIFLLQQRKLFDHVTDSSLEKRCTDLASLLVLRLRSKYISYMLIEKYLDGWKKMSDDLASVQQCPPATPI